MLGPYSGKYITEDSINIDIHNQWLWEVRNSSLLYSVFPADSTIDIQIIMDHSGEILSNIVLFKILSLVLYGL